MGTVLDVDAVAGAGWVGITVVDSVDFGFVGKGLDLAGAGAGAGGIHEAETTVVVTIGLVVGYVVTIGNEVLAVMSNRDLTAWDKAIEEDPGRRHGRGRPRGAWSRLCGALYCKVMTWRLRRNQRGPVRGKE